MDINSKRTSHPSHTCIMGKRVIDALYSPITHAIEKNTERIYLTDRASCQVVVLTASYDFITAFHPGIQMYPWGIAVSGDSIYVTDVKISVSLRIEVFAKSRRNGMQQR